MYKLTYKKKMLGQRSHPLYKTYENILQRCNNVEHRDYPNYGGRGITIAKEWCGAYGFVNFAKYMGNKPEGMSIDRIDNDGGYKPGNVRWATQRQQTLNSRVRSTNTSGAKGITWEKRRSKWHARLTVNDKNIHVGYFDDINEAIQARAAREVQA